MLITSVAGFFVMPCAKPERVGLLLPGREVHKGCFTTK